MNDTTTTINCLNNLLQYLNDSFNGYQLNQEDVSDSKLKSSLEKLCLNRSAMIEEVKAKISACGGVPTDQQTISGTLHQWYQEIKNAVTGGDPAAISEQIRFGEGVLIDQYKKALNEQLPEPIREMLLNQLSQIEDGLKEINVETVD